MAKNSAPNKTNKPAELKNAKIKKALNERDYVRRLPSTQLNR